MLYRIDAAPSHDEVVRTVEGFADPRIEYSALKSTSSAKVMHLVPISFHNSHNSHNSHNFHNSQCLSQYSPQDAGYAATDRVLSRALQRGDCAWISVTTSDNAYGSEVRLIRSVVPSFTVLTFS